MPAPLWTYGLIAGGTAAFLWARGRQAQAAKAIVEQVTGPAAVSPVEGGDLDPPAVRRIAFAYPRSATHTHQGVDFPAPSGTPVYAARRGTVVHTNRELATGYSGYGRAIVIQSDAAPPLLPPIWHIYAHMQDVLVQPGQQVRAGEQIGTVGRTCFRKTDPTALCKGAHLHFETSPRPFPQQAEAWRYHPADVVAAWQGRPTELRTT